MATKKQIWSVDCETDPFEAGIIVQPFIWGVYHGYTKTPFYKEFLGTGENYVCTSDDIKNLVDYLSQQNVIVYAHNGGKFDWHFLSEFFEPSDDLLVINGRLSKFKIGKCEFRDSYNIIPRPLSAYKKDEFNYLYMAEIHRHNYMDEIKKYLKSDCENLWNLVSEFERDYGRNITQASAAMNYWKSGLKKSDGTRIRNEVPRSKAHFYDTFKPFYYGGRTQCFIGGDFKVNAKSIDINSAYPFAMLEKHAYGLLYIKESGKPKTDYKKWGPLFLQIKCISKGAFPYNGLSKKRYYPADEISRYYFITGWELIAAIETETVGEIQFIEYFEFSELKSFKRYVKYFYELRKKFPKETHPGQNLFAKIFMNSLYGKFCADPRKYKSYSLKPADAYAEFAGQSKYTTKLFREWCLVGELQDDPKGFFNVATGASITGYVRAMLWRSICAANKPMYCDTDSITAKSFGKEIVLGTELGQWEIEYKYDRIVIAGRKLYAFHIAGKNGDASSWKIASKGARLDYQQIIEAANGKEVFYNSIAPTFSVLRKEPTFVNRIITDTFEDITTVPRKDDPMFET